MSLLTELPNFLLGLDMLDSMVARFQKVQTGMRAAVAESRDLTPDELDTFCQDAEQEDRDYEAAIEAKRQEAIAGDSDKVSPSGDTGADIRP